MNPSYVLSTCISWDIGGIVLHDSPTLCTSNHYDTITMMTWGGEMVSRGAQTLWVHVVNRTNHLFGHVVVPILGPFWTLCVQVVSLWDQRVSCMCTGSCLMTLWPCVHIHYIIHTKTVSGTVPLRGYLHRHLQTLLYTLTVLTSSSRHHTMLCIHTS